MSSLTQAEIQELADVWYKKLDVHASLDEFKPLLAREGVSMVFPEATLAGWDKFADWYEGGHGLPGVINIFFDEVHELKSVESTPAGEDKATVKVVVKWEASVWKNPAAKSERIVLDAYQTWEVIRSPESGKPVILTYIVDELKYYEGSAKL